MIRTFLVELQKPLGAERPQIARQCRLGAIGTMAAVVLVSLALLGAVPTGRLVGWAILCGATLGAALWMPVTVKALHLGHAALLALPWATFPLGLLSQSGETVQLLGLLLCASSLLYAGIVYRGAILPSALYMGLVCLGMLSFLPFHWRLEHGAMAVFGLGLAVFVGYLTHKLVLARQPPLGDQVSGLANRRIFFDALREALNRGDYALLAFELSGLGRVNSLYGRRAGDVLLALAGQRIRRELNGRGLAARLGGDEFAVLVGGGEEAGCKLALDLAASLSKPAIAEGREVMVHAAIGVALHPQHGDTAAGLMRKASIAYRHAKEEGDSSVALYDPAFEVSGNDADPLGEALEAVISAGGLDLFYQPKIDLVSGALVGAEALIRWTHPTLGPVSPERFLALAADRALIHPLTDLVFDRVTRDIHTWRDHGIRFGRIALNIHPVDLKDPDHLMSLVEGLLVRDVGPDEVALEITEGCFVGRGRDTAPEVLGEIAAMGFSLSLDDFGTGYAALTHLQSLPVGEVKIDKSFVENITTSSGDRAIVEALVSMASACGLKTVAEGIEHAEQARILRQIGVNIGQGHYWSSPVSAVEYQAVAGQIIVA